MKNTHVGLVVLLGVLAAMQLVGCSSCGEDADDEALIRKLIDQAAAHAEQQNADALVGLTTGDFTAEPGQNNRQTVKRPLFIAFQHYGTFTVEYPRPSVSVDGERAEAQVSFLILRAGAPLPGLKDLRGEPDSWLEKVRDMADLYHMKIALVKEGDRWLVQRAHIQGTQGLVAH
jgi:hypothetical protein